MLTIVTIIAAVLGLAVGSFLNVLIHRIPAGLSLTRPPSSCPHCGHRIRWYDNVPVISWLVLRGRCRDCGAPISLRYPLVELAAGVAFALVALCFAPDGWLGPLVVAPDDSASGEALGVAAQYVVLVALLWLAGASIALAAIDIEHERLPDRIVLPTIAVELILLAGAAALSADLAGILRALIGGAAEFVFFIVVRIVSRGGMGLGDAKLSAVLGLVTAWVGWPSFGLALFAGFVLGGLFGVVMLATRRADRKSRTPFGPWLLAGAWVGIVAGPAAWTWYIGVLGLR